MSDPNVFNWASTAGKATKERESLWLKQKAVQNQDAATLARAEAARELRLEKANNDLLQEIRNGVQSAVNAYSLEAGDSVQMSAPVPISNWQKIGFTIGKTFVSGHGNSPTQVYLTTRIQTSFVFLSLTRAVIYQTYKAVGDPLEIDRKMEMHAHQEHFELVLNDESESFTIVDHTGEIVDRGELVKRICLPLFELERPA